MTVRLLLYNIMVLTLAAAAMPWVLYQALFVPRRRTGLVQRLGMAPAMRNKAVWCHAVSVGEVRAAAPMLEILQKDPRTRDRIAVSTVTVTGQETARRECGFASSIFYFPLDLPLAVGRSVRRTRPELFITAETEIWPNFMSACFRRRIPVVVVNGRISDTSYPRYMRFRWFFRPFLEAVSLFLMQSEEDARRIVRMGAKPETVKVTGNMKYDREPDPVKLPPGIVQWAREGFLLVAGSTHTGEEEILLDAVRATDHSEILLALVPRHPERFDQAASLLEDRGVPFTRYSAVGERTTLEGVKVLLVDAMGVLDAFYALADIAFVGGSLVPVGGHNLLEPAMYGVPVLTGPYTHNFRDIAGVLVEGGGCFIVRDKRSVSDLLKTLIENNSRLTAAGEAAMSVSRAEKGASRKNVDEVLSLLENREKAGSVS